jgi:AraC family transcriptional regulator
MKRCSTNILGTSLRSADFRHLRAAETRYAACAYIPPHEHEFGYLSLVLHGGFEEKVGRGSQSNSSASVVFMPSGTAHSEQMSPEGARSFTVVLKPTLLANTPMTSHPQSCQWFHGGPAAKLMLRAYQDFLLEADRADFALAEHIFELCSLLNHPDPTSSRLASRSLCAAVDLLHAHPTPDFSFGELAATVGVDPAYLARAFHRKLGCTLSQYRRRLWVRKAAHLLASTHEPIAQVALTAGFADQSHLTRIFKSEIGLTPQAYRSLTGQK